jgi:PAS domain S-box-containing protein
MDNRTETIETDADALKNRVQELERQLAEAKAAIQTLMAEQNLVGISQPVKQGLETELEQDRAQLKAILNSLTEGVMIFDLKGKILDVNPAGLEIAGFTTVAELQQGAADLFHLFEVFSLDGKTLPMVEWPLSRVLNGETISGLDLEIHRKDTGRVWISSNSGTLVRSSAGEPMLGVLTLRDITERKKAEEALQRSEAVLAQAGKMAQIGAWDIEFSNYDDLNDNPLRWSDEVYRILGYEPGKVEVTNELFFEHVHPKDRQRVRDAVAQAMAERRSYEIEHRIVRPDGGERVVHEFASIEFDDLGRPLRMVGAVQDITDRKRAEEALRSSEARFRQLADSMPQLVWTAGPDGRVDYYNQRYKEYDGLAPTGGGFWHWSPVLHPEDEPPTIDTWTHSVETGEIYQVEHRVRMADGSYRWHLSRGIPFRDGQGQIERWFGTATDINDLKRAEEELRNRNEGLALLSDTAGELLQSIDPASLLDRLFGRLAFLLGLEIYVHYRLSEDGSHLILKALSGFPSEVHKDMQRLKLRQGVCGTAAVRRQPIVVENVQQSADKRANLIRSLGLNAYVCYPLIARGKLIGTLSFGTRSRAHFEPAALDLLQAASNLVAAAILRNQDEAALQAYTKRLESSNRDLQEFAFVASHDLQEPLRKIEAFSDALLQKATKLDERQQDHLERMQKASERMRSMVDGLLQLSRLTTRARPFELVDLSKITAEVVSDLELRIRRTGGTIELGDLPEVEADPVQMRQLFQNLIGNALKFRRPEVQPVVRVWARQRTTDDGRRTTDDRRRTVDGEAPATASGPRSAVGGQVSSGQPFVDHYSEITNKIEIIVEDNGIGFDEELAGRLFQPFQRLVGRSEYEGSGMGLAICRRIIERHGGEIIARSQKGQGTSFIVTLPIVQKSLGIEEFDE